MAVRGVRIVRTQQGADYFGVPIGTRIVPGRGNDDKDSSSAKDSAPQGSIEEVPYKRKPLSTSGDRALTINGHTYWIPEDATVFKFKGKESPRIIFDKDGNPYVVDDGGEIELTPKLFEEYKKRFLDGQISSNKEAYSEDTSSGEGEAVPKSLEKAFPSSDYEYSRKNGWGNDPIEAYSGLLQYEEDGVQKATGYQSVIVRFSDGSTRRYEYVDGSGEMWNLPEGVFENLDGIAPIGVFYSLTSKRDKGE